MPSRWVVVVLVAVLVAVLWVASRATSSTVEAFDESVCAHAIARDVDLDLVPEWLAAVPERGCMAGVELRAGTPLRFELERLAQEPDLTALLVLGAEDRMYASLTAPAAAVAAAATDAAVLTVADVPGRRVHCADAHSAWVFRRVLVAHGIDPARFDLAAERTDPTAAVFAMCAPRSAFARAVAARGDRAFHVVAPSCDRAKLAALLPFTTVVASALPAQTGAITACADCVLYAAARGDVARGAREWIRARAAEVVRGRVEDPTAYRGTLPTADEPLPDREQALAAAAARGELPVSASVAGPAGLRNVRKSSTGFRKGFVDVFALPLTPTAGLPSMRGDTIVLSSQPDPDLNGTWYVNDARDGVLAVANAVHLRLGRQDARALVENGIMSSAADIDAQTASENENVRVRVAVPTPVFASGTHPFVLRAGDPVRVDELEFFGTVIEYGETEVVLEGKADEDEAILQDASGALYRCFDRSVPDADCPDDLWDRPCLADAECPYYLANLNYANAFGGCRDGYCEMPLGVRNRTYRRPNTDDQPLCYNCHEADDAMRCCEDQANRKWPAASPDFAFAGDAEARRQALGPAGKDARLAWHSLGHKN